MFEAIKRKALLTKDDIFHMYHHKNGIQGEKFFKVIRKPIYKGYYKAVMCETITFYCYECEKKLISGSIMSIDDNITGIRSSNTYKLLPKTDKIIKVYLNYGDPYTIIADTINTIENV